MKTTTLLALSLAFAAGATNAQVLRRDSAIVAGAADSLSYTGGGLWLVSPDRSKFSKLDVPSPWDTTIAWSNSIAIHPHNHLVYVGTMGQEPLGAGNIYELLIVVDRVVRVRRLSTPVFARYSSISALTVRHDKLWFVSNQEFGYVPIAGGRPTVVYTFDMSKQGSPQALATNGREIYIGMAGAFNTHNFYVYDPEAPNAVPVGLLSTPNIAYGTSIGQMTIADSGQVFATDFGGHGHLIDPITKKVVTINLGKRAPLGTGHGGTFNPWTREYFCAPSAGNTPREIHLFDQTADAWRPQPLGVTGPPGFATNIGSAHARPFESYGAGCPGKNAKEPRITSKGLARVGSSGFELGLRDADAKRPAVLVLGASQHEWSGLDLPLPLDALGASGCQLLAAVDAAGVFQTDGEGKARVSLVIPTDTRFSGIDLFAQWLIATPANGFGFVTSDAGRLAIR